MPTDSATSIAVPSPKIVDRLPPHVFFLVSAVFHYLGPSFAVLLFASLAPPGVAWLRIASAGLIFAIWRRPWRTFATLASRDMAIIVALGVVLAAMNTLFYEAIARLPLATVGAIEFLGPITVAAYGVRARRNLLALVLAVAGIFVLTDIRIAGEPLGYVFAFTNCALFMGYIILGHHISSGGAGVSGIDRLGCAMLVATIAALPFGLDSALPAFSNPLLLAAAIGVGVSSSVIPYVCDQLAMSRLPRASFALLLSLLPASATVIGFIVLRQVPSLTELAGIALVIAGVALHRTYKS
ncbi:EamA family transporter [Sphingobium sp. BYY-5]|uniref:EamA family transporter n=1 Tax=Sphingobium sp. BYY-5 TaxID=2926400 RepID=UPI001FA79CF4|nr:EamA family transporter [Sphingobium sp. BYY-5]MCI4588698.1 EamA family transporter [Sphingobium sp. BYY-5]